jgi:PAS domain S-box-containing protein
MAIRPLLAAIAAWLLLAPWVAVAGTLLLTPEEREWLQLHPVIRYGSDPEAGTYSSVEQGKHAGLTADYMRALESRIGVAFEFRPYGSWSALQAATRNREIDVVALMIRPAQGDGHLIYSTPLLRYQYPPVIGIRSDWPQLEAIINKAQRSFAPEEVEALRQSWLEPTKRAYSGQQLTVVVLTLTASGLAIALLIVLWAARKQRSLARDIERSEAALDAFFDASPAGMAILDRALNFVRINETQARMNGRSAAEHIGHPIEEIVPDASSMVVTQLREVLVTGRSFHNIEITGNAGDNRKQDAYWLVSYFPIYIQSGRNPIGVGTVVLDIGDRKRAELALRDSENHLRKVSDHIPVAVFQYRTDPRGKQGFTYLSEGIQRVLLRKPEEIVADPGLLLDAVHPEDRGSLMHTWATLSRHPDATQEAEWTGRRNPAAGPECWLQIRGTIESAVDGAIAVSGVILDITQLKNIQLALERSRADLRRLGAHREGLIEREHQRLAREFHDELGQVLTTARMHLQLLERSLPEDSADARDAARNIEAMIADAYRSVKTIASDLRPAALNLGLAAAVEWIAARILGQAGIQCSISCSPVADRLDDDYAIALFRIVQESLTNTVRHAMAKHVHITLSEHDGEMSLLVEDDGRGFDVQLVDHAANFGLLGISERVTSLGGVLDIDSSPGSGTRLAVTLPQVPLKADNADRSPNSP